MTSSTRNLRVSLLTTASNRCLVGLVAGLSVSSLHAVDWNGSGSRDWNAAANWTPSGVPSGANAVINTNTPNIALISANVTLTPVDIIVGVNAGSNARLDHTGGSHQTGNGNWMFVGRTAGTGTYNLADTTGSGGPFTTYGLGAGSMNVRGRLIIGGESSAGSNGTVNVNTSGSLTVRDNLLIGTGNATSTDTGVLNIDAGTMSSGNWTEIGRGGPNCKGTINISGGTFRKEGANGAIIGAEGGKGFGKFTGGSFISTVTGANGQFRIGNNPGSAGKLEVSGTALVDIAHEIWVGNNNATGDLTFSGGQIKTTSWVAIGRRDGTNPGGTGTVTMTGGTWTKTGDSNFIVGASGSGTMDMSGGIVDVGSSNVVDRGVTWVGEQNNCTGLLTLSGTADFRTVRMTLGVQSGTTSTVNLNGGTLTVGQITGGAGTHAVHFNGTQLVARSNQTAFVATLGTADIKAGGLKVNTNGFNLTIPQVLTAGSPAGGVVKSGTGTLTLSAANTYTGDHTVNGGKLAVTTDFTGGGSFTVANSASLGVAQIFDTSSVNAPSVSFGSTGSSLDLDLGEIAGNPAVAPLNVTGSLTLNGPVTINIADRLPAIGDIPLLSYVGPKLGTGSFVLGSLPNGVVGNLVDNGTGLVSLHVNSVSLPIWNGTLAGGIWDTSTQNWIDGVTSLPTAYANPAPVAFYDGAAGTTDVVLNSTVAPSAVVFDHSGPYSLTGSGKITGSTGLSKKGSGTTTIGTANDFTGPVTVSGGILQLASIANGGAPSPLGASSASAANLVLDGGTLAYTGTAGVSDRGLTLNTTSTISVTDSLSLGGPIVTAAGSLVKVGAGNLTLNNNGAMTIGSVSPGFRVQEGTLTLSGSGSQVVTVVGEMYIANTPDVPANLVLNNTTLVTSNFLAIGRGNGNDGVCNLTATNSVMQTTSFSTGYNNGLANNASEAHVTLNDTTWTNNGVTYLAESTGSSATMVMNGTSQLNAAGNILLGRFAGTTAELTLKDSAKINKTTGYAGLGAGGSAIITLQDNASFTSNVDDFNIGDGANASGTMNLQGNASVSASQIYIGKNAGATGILNMSGASSFQSSTFITLGRFAGGIGTVNVPSGSFGQNGATQVLYIGQEGSGILNISGTGSVTSSGTALLLAGASSANGVVNLNGGTLTTKQVAKGPAGNSEFYFNGGVLKANTGANVNFMAGIDVAVIKAGGATIDTNGQNLTVAQNLSDDGGGGAFVKTGLGTLQLNGSNSFGGTTTVSAGTLGGTGSIAGPLAVPAGSAIAPGASAGTFTAGATTIDGTYVCEIDGLTADKLAVNGALVISPGAVLDINVLNAPTAPAYVIASYGTLSGTFTVQDLPAGYTVNYAYNDGVSSNNIAIVSGAATPYQNWTATYFPGVTDPNIVGPNADPDKDGSPNSLEFALGGVPNNGANGPKIYVFSADSSDAGTEKELLMTIAVRGNPTFSGSPSPTATVDGFSYVIQGSLAFQNFTAPVSPVTPVAPAAPNDQPPAGYVWRSFSLDGSNNLPGKGFMRVSVTPVP